MDGPVREDGQIQGDTLTLGGLRCKENSRPDHRNMTGFARLPKGVVDPRGLEPLASWMPSRRSPD